MAMHALAGAAAPTSYQALLNMDQSVLDAIPVAVYVCSADGVLVRFNRRAVELWGRTPHAGDNDERFCGAFRLYEPNGHRLARARNPMAAVLRTGVPIHDREVIIERPNGSRIVALVNIEPLKSLAGDIEGAVNCFQDITERKRAEQLLAQSEHRIRELLDALPAAIYTTDAEGRITMFNRAAAELSGREPQLGQDKWCVTWRLYRPDGSVLPHDACPLAVALKEDRAIRGVAAIAERPNGTRVPIMPFPTPLHDASGLLKGAVNMLVDLTELRRVEDGLRDNEERLRLAMQTGKIALWDWNILSDRVSWTDSFFAMLRVDKEALEATRAGFFAIVHTEDRRHVQASIERALTDDAPCELEFRAVRPDGQVVWLFANALVLRDGDRPIRMVGAMFDITERKQAEAQRDLLVAELSHRVKNTLATVISIAQQSFSKGQSVEEERRSFAARIQALAQTHGRLAEANWSGVSFRTILLDEFAPYWQEDGQNLRLCGPDIVLNSKHAVMLGMAFHELVTNAVKHGSLSRAGGLVDISWDLIAGPRERLQIRWTESNGPRIAPPTRRGFGRLLLERALASDLRGHVHMDFAEEGLKCVVTIPLREAADLPD